MSSHISIRNKPTPNLTEVERSGVWVAAKRPGSAWKHRVEYWEKLGLIPDANKKKLTVVVPRSRQGNLVKEVIFYHTALLDRLDKKDWSASRKEKCKAFRVPQERRFIDGGEHWRTGKAARFLEVGKQALLGSNLPRERIEVAGRLTSYFPVPGLREERKRHEDLELLSKDEVTLEEATRRIGRSSWTLRDKAWCDENGIRQIRRTSYRRGQASPYVKFSFRAADLDSYIERNLDRSDAWKLEPHVIDAWRRRLAADTDGGAEDGNTLLPQVEHPPAPKPIEKLCQTVRNSTGSNKDKVMRLQRDLRQQGLAADAPPCFFPMVMSYDAVKNLMGCIRVYAKRCEDKEAKIEKAKLQKSL